MSTGQTSWQDAIIKVLKDAKKPIYYGEITELIIKEGLRKKVGATPANAVVSQITTSMKRSSKRSPYIKLDRGKYGLKEFNYTELEESEEEERDKIITSFGMFWKRDNVDWKKTNIFGIERQGSDRINFYNQIGVYLLYDGREVIYVGRSEDKIGSRLKDHTTDRLSGRWDRFSWFGLLPISEDGKLGKLPSGYKTEKLITVLETILIEAVEPRQNRKGADGLGEAEYIQIVDPKLEKERAIAVINKD